MITGDFISILIIPVIKLLPVFELCLIFKQHVKDSMHKNQHILDLLTTRLEDQLVRNVRVSDYVISDHCTVWWEAPCLKIPGLERMSVCFRKIRSIDRDQFVQDIIDSSLVNHGDFLDVSALSDCYDNTMRSLIDQYAPVKKRIFTAGPAAP